MWVSMSPAQSCHRRSTPSRRVDDVPASLQSSKVPVHRILLLVLLSVKTHRRVATGNTKSREVARALAGTAPSSTARNPSTRRGFLRCRACHLTYTRSGRCDRACDDLPAYTNTCKHKSKPWSAPRDDSCIGFKEPVEPRCQIGSAYPDNNG